jgi:1,4-dihydroxy-2-naphthoate octaprenyltransferase
MNMDTMLFSQPTLLERAQPYIAIQELPKHLANLLPFMLGSTLAYWQTGTLSWPVLLVALLATFLLTDGTYVGNEYFDYENDKANSTRIGGDEKIGVGTTGGTRVLVRGLIPRKHALYMAVASFALAVPVGLYLRYGLHTGPLTIPLGVLGILVGWFYTAPPIKACYRGLGEVFIAVAQGIVVFGAYYVQAGFSWTPIIVSLPWFIALPALKILREFPDYEADRATGKRGLTVIFGRERMAYVYSALIVLALLAFVPVMMLLNSKVAVVVSIPIVLFAYSISIIATGQWRDAKRLESAAVTAFIAMLTIPTALAFAFLFDALTR